MRTIAREAKQISIFLENRAGVVADLTDSLTDNEINIQAITVLDTHDIGTLRMVVDNFDRAIQVFGDIGAAYMVTPVLTLEIPNVPGGFARIARILGTAGINIEYVYGSAIPGSERTLGVFRVNNVERALTLPYEGNGREP